LVALGVTVDDGVPEDEGDPLWLLVPERVGDLVCDAVAVSVPDRVWVEVVDWVRVGDCV
jgi:hypothetical protein